MDFKPIEKSDKALFDDYFQREYYENSHFSFINLFMWRKLFRVSFAVLDDVLYVLSKWQGEVQLLQPFGEREKLPSAIAEQLKWCKDNNIRYKAVDVTDPVTEIFERYGGFSVIPDRDNYDYLYESRELIELKGRRYHAKKNHLNSFWRDYPQAECLPITEEIIPACQQTDDEWSRLRHLEQPDDLLIPAEREAVQEIFADFGYFGLKGMAIRLDGRIAAFSFGEQLNKDTAVIHVEKADTEIRGAYAAINQAFAREWADLRYINREEDMGVAGLRQAKESYKPCRMVEKYIVTVK